MSDLEKRIDAYLDGAAEEHARLRGLLAPLAVEGETAEETLARALAERRAIVDAREPVERLEERVQALEAHAVNLLATLEERPAGVAVTTGPLPSMRERVALLERQVQQLQRWDLHREHERLKTATQVEALEAQVAAYAEWARRQQEAR